MPRISSFYGIVIVMYRDEHNPPHFHVLFGSQRASFTIAPLRLMAGRLSARAERLVREWASMHMDELLGNWDRARNGEDLFRIDPLD